MSATMQISLEILKRDFPGEFIRIRHDIEYHPADSPDILPDAFMVQVGYLRDGRKFHGESLDALVTEVRAMDATCAECGYGAVDNQGLCVIDVSHVALRTGGSNDKSNN